jgi:hypothetical protein
MLHQRGRYFAGRTHWLKASHAMVLLLALQACGLQRSTDSPDARQSLQTNTVSTGELEVENATSSDSVRRGGSKRDAMDYPGNSALEYDLEHPDQTWSLPSTLKEVSDIAVLSENEIACVQDERGVVFVYDIKSKSITDEVRFATKGDYEGLTIVDSKLFVLRSDGLLFELSSLRHHPAVQTYDLHLPYKESEGLCLDAKHDRLLIAPKSYEQTETGKDSHPIYAFELSARALAAAPAFEVSVRAIRHFAKHHDLPIPRRVKRDGQSLHSALRFKPSAIAVHPLTGEVFILSSVDHVLVACTETGSITGYALLDASLYRQPEGIAFFPNGDMLISNEAAGKEATLLALHWKKKAK